MHIIVFNLNWMAFNIMLAMIPVFFGWLMIRTRTTFLKFLYGSIWFIFLPNSIYLLTDIVHFFEDWSKIGLPYRGIFIFEYMILMLFGIFSFILGLYPLEQLFPKSKNKKQKRKYLVIYVCNFLIGFGMVLGRVERINSWDIITNIPHVTYEIIHTITSAELLSLAIFFGFLSNVIYFSLKNWIAPERFCKSA